MSNSKTINYDLQGGDKILCLQNLSLNFGKKKVLDQVSVEFKKGEAVLITGNNGVGKTSLLRCIAGVYHANSGDIRFTPSITPYEIGFISDKMSLFEGLTLEQGINLHQKVFDISQYDETLINRLNIKKNQKIKNLSVGERALYHLSLILSQRPKILLIDEILHSLDAFLRDIFIESLIEMIDELGTTLIMVNHTFTETGQIPERILILEDGGFTIDESREELQYKMKKIVTQDKINESLPLVFKKESTTINEYYIYPFTSDLAKKYNYDFLEVDLTEIIKSFMGGYYAKQRN